MQDVAFYPIDCMETVSGQASVSRKKRIGVEIVQLKATDNDEWLEVHLFTSLIN